MASPAGVILATSQAGRPFPLDRPAHLVPLANRPLLDHVLHAMHDAGLERVAIVVDGQTAVATRAIAGDGAAFGVDVEYVEQDAGGGYASALSRAFERTGDVPCVVHHGRVFLAGSLRGAVSDFTRRLADCVVLVGSRPQGAPSRGQLLKLCAQRARGDRVLPLGIDLCRPAVLERLHARAGSNSLSDALADLAADGQAEAWAVRGAAVRLDSCDAVLEATRLALDELEADWACADVADTRVHGRVVIAPSAVVRSSVIRGPAVIGAGVNLSHSYVGPYTVVGDGSQVDGVEVESSVLLSDVTVRSPGWRLEDSVIGAGAQVTRGFELPAGVRLRVADGALIHVT